MNNIIKTREAWKLKLEGVELEAISKDLSIDAAYINKIFIYTNVDHYTLVKKGKISYYDDISFFLRSIDNKKETIKLLSKSIKYKKTLFRNILIATAIIVHIFIIF